MNTHDLAFKAANGMLSFDAEGEWRLNQKEVERFARLVRAQVLEEVEQKVPCGKHTDKWGSCRIADYNRGWNDYRKQCAAAIQALKEQT